MTNAEVLHLRAERAVLPGGVVPGASLLVQGGLIRWAGPAADASPPPGAVELDLAGTVCPGFVDVQVNGAAGRDFMACTSEGWEAAGAYLLSTGTTAFVPTLISAPLERMREAVRGAVEACRSLSTPRAVGIHLEGPLLSERFPGAHDPTAIEATRPADLLPLVEEGDGWVRMVTLAPERPGAMEVAGRIAASGVVVSVGHTAATYREAREAVEVGARSVTHLFNAQRGLHHREPGVPGAAFDLPELTCGLILDLLHVHPAVARMALRSLGHRAFLVTDALSPAGLPPGRFRIGGREVSTESGAPRLPDGTLFGSTLSMARAFSNAVDLGFGLEDAVRWTSTIPADLVGRADLGRLGEGARADLVVLDDRLEVAAVWVDGVEVFSR